MARRYWLFKSDPETFAWADLRAARGGAVVWDGVRNYQARNTLRDDVQVGDGVLFYHSGSDKAVVGTARVVQAGHPDATQFDPKHAGFDPGASRDAPRWYAVGVVPDAEFAAPVSLSALRGAPGLEGMVLLTKGSRLSVQPVTAAEWGIVTRLGRASAPGVNVRGRRPSPRR